MEDIKVEGAAEGYVARAMLHHYGARASLSTEFAPMWEYLAKYYPK